jgi:hypothetical protein
VDVSETIGAALERAGPDLQRSIDFHDRPLPKSGAGTVLTRELRAPYWADREP